MTDLLEPSPETPVSAREGRVTATGRMWLWAVFLPVVTFLARNMCVWPGPRSLGVVAATLLSASVFTVLLALAAVPASVYFGATSLVHMKKDGELLRRASIALSCLCFVSLWFLAMWSANALRHRAFVRASQVGDRIVQALGRYRHDNGEYPESLKRLIPGYLDEVPYTEMIAYPDFSYRKDRNGIENNPGSFELWISCPTGMLNFDSFIYWPSETYPDRLQGNGVERIRTWAYIHE
jgi:hypothetical protein